ncbi:MAG: hypothetical protein QME52_11645, partial [Bacteroidota bacterium]|nr:hypothetical protein [Bacteroidota bacterium]
DIGASGGNGIVLMPALSISPISEFRFQVNHEYFNNKNLNSLTSLSLTTGFSSNLEIYFKASTENWMNSAPLRRVGYGAKFIFPMSFEAVNYPALWFESVQGVNELENSLFKLKLIHAAVVINPDLFNSSPTFLIGVSSTNVSDRLFLATGISKTITDNIRIGSEITYNYYSSDDVRGSVLINKRIFSNLGIQFVSTYLTSPSLNTWSFSLGLALSTSDIIFFPRAIESNDKKLVPDFDELMKSLQDVEKKDETK